MPIWIQKSPTLVWLEYLGLIKLKPKLRKWSEHSKYLLYVLSGHFVSFFFLPFVYLLFIQYLQGLHASEVCCAHGHCSIKSYVFSFGVLVLEIISGKKNKGFSDPEHSLNLLEHVRKMIIYFKTSWTVSY